MYALGKGLDSDLDNFVSAYEVRKPEDEAHELAETAQMFEDLDRIESSYRVP